MNVYIETNFVLELALAQEQSESCEGILKLCEARSVRLVVPAYSLAEPYEALARRQKQRKKMKEDLDVELGQIARSAMYEDELRGFRDLTALLIDSADEGAKRLEQVRSRMIKAACVIPLDASVLARAGEYQREHGFSAQDAFVYSSVLSDLKRVAVMQSCFLNKDSKDFDDQSIVDELRSHNCMLLPRFDSGYDFIRKALC